MPTINPSIVIEDLDGKPLKLGPIDDPVARKQISELVGRYQRAPDAEKPNIEALLAAMSTELTPVATVGRAICQALVGTLDGDENASGESKTDRIMWAMRIKQAMAEGPQASVRFDEEPMKQIKERVNKAYPAALIVARVFAAIVADPAPPLAAA